MPGDPDKDLVLEELEALKTRLDASLAGLAGKVEHIPLHEIVGVLIKHIADQHAEIQALKRQLADAQKARSGDQGQV